MMTDDELDALNGDIRRTGIDHIFTRHCTEDHAYGYLKSRLGGRIEQFSSGTNMIFNKQPIPLVVPRNPVG